MWADKGEKLPEALKMIRKAVDIEPMNGAYLDSLGWVYFKMGEYELAEDNLRQAVNRDQTDPTVHVHMGDLYEKTGTDPPGGGAVAAFSRRVCQIVAGRRRAGRRGQGAEEAGERAGEAGQRRRRSEPGKPE